IRVEMTGRDVTRACGPRFTRQSSHALGAAEIAALAIAAPEPASHGMIEGQAVLLQLTVEAFENIARLGRGISRRPCFAGKFDELFAQPGKNSFVHGDSNRGADAISAA